MTNESANSNEFIFKILTGDQFHEAKASGLFAGSPDDARDGFIHFSTETQVAGTLQKHFAGQSGLVILRFAANSFGEELKWEPSRNGELFPHLYGVFNMSQAEDVTSIFLT